MASGNPPLKVVFDREASRELREIWRYNVQKYGSDHADRYEDFLLLSILGLSHAYGEGRPIPNRPGLRHIVIRRSRRGAGHVAVYRVDDVVGTVNVLHIFHTAQDIQGRLENE